MYKPSIKYLTISDVHLGHPKNPASRILKNLTSFFNDFQVRKDLDIVFIAGDFWDRLIEFSDVSIDEFIAWSAMFYRWCSLSNISVRVLEGTPSHDWKQSTKFTALQHSMFPELDLKYIPALCIERMDKLGIDILYVPDEWHPETKETYRQVQVMMEELDIDKVDIAIMHGCFDYQLPPAAAKVPRHIEADYLSIVRYYINIGHIHVHSVYERIIATGSFDRLTHGEEEAKGGAEMTINADGTMSFFFMENKNALVFKTISVAQPDIDLALNYIDRRTVNLPIGSHVRIKAKKDHPVIIAFDEVKRKFPMLVFTKKTNEEEKEDQYSLISHTDIDSQTYKPIAIDKTNIENLLLEEILLKGELTPSQLELVSVQLRSVQ